MNTFEGFVAAVTKGDIERMRSTFDSKYVTMSDNAGWTALHKACDKDKVEVVRFLLDQGWDIECENKKKWRPLHRAAFNGHISIIKELINRGCCVKAVNNTGKTALDISIKQKKFDCEKVLQEAEQGMLSKMSNNSTCKSEEASSLYQETLIDSIHSKDDSKNQRFLGKGAYGQVFLRTNIKNNQHYAVKEVLTSSDNISIMREVEALKNEIKIYIKLESNPRIVQYFYTRQDDRALYIYMEYMAGGSLKNYLDSKGALPHQKIAKYTKQILEGLDFLHDHKIIHRDIKCDNILKDLDDNIKLSDFGLSKNLESISMQRGSTDGVVNTTNTFCGTPYWMAPEVLNGDDYSVLADVWSLGATVIEMLTGKHPYPELNAYTAMKKIGEEKTIKYEPKEPLSKTFQSFMDMVLVPEPKLRANVKTLLKTDFIVEVSDCDLN